MTYQTSSEPGADLELVRRAVRLADHTGRTGWARCSCPLCVQRVGTQDRRASLGINFDTGRYHCFRCAAWGYLRAGDKNAPARIAEEPEEGAPDLGPPEDWTPLWEPPGDSASVLAAARAYLRRRRVSSQTIRDVQIGACLRGWARGRVVVPVLAADRRTWVGWQGRFWGQCPPAIPKYLTAGGMDRFNTVFNEAALLVETDRPVMVVEGTFDALPYWPDVVALLGKPSAGQEAKLRRAPRPVVCCLDGDAWLECEMLAMRLQLDGAAASWVKLPPGEDPGSVDPAWLTQKVNEAAGAQ
jgi:hypothetical protein